MSVKEGTGIGVQNTIDISTLVIRTKLDPLGQLESEQELKSSLQELDKSLRRAEESLERLDSAITELEKSLE